MYNKWKSRRFLIALWAIFLITYIVIFKTVEWITLTSLLVTLVIAFVGSETLTKRYFSDKEKKDK